MTLCKLGNWSNVDDLKQSIVYTDTLLAITYMMTADVIWVEVVINENDDFITIGLLHGMINDVILNVCAEMK